MTGSSGPCRRPAPSRAAPGRRQRDTRGRCRAGPRRCGHRRRCRCRHSAHRRWWPERWRVGGGLAGAQPEHGRERRARELLHVQQGDAGELPVTLPWQVDGPPVGIRHAQLIARHRPTYCAAGTGVVGGAAAIAVSVRAQGSGRCTCAATCSRCIVSCRIASRNIASRRGGRRRASSSGSPCRSLRDVGCTLAAARSLQGMAASAGRRLGRARGPVGRDALLATAHAGKSMTRHGRVPPAKLAQSVGRRALAARSH